MNDVCVPVNALGVPLLGKEGLPTSAEQAAHVFVGIEQVIIRAMCSKALDLRAVIYDGFIAAPQSVEALEHHAREVAEKTLGFPLSLSLKATPFNDPIPDPESDPWDF